MADTLAFDGDATRIRFYEFSRKIRLASKCHIRYFPNTLAFLSMRNAWPQQSEGQGGPHELREYFENRLAPTSM